MTSTSPRTTPTTSLPRARGRRVKRGIVAGYIHDISPRHRAPAPASVPVPVDAPVLALVPAPALEPEPAALAAPPAT